MTANQRPVRVYSLKTAAEALSISLRMLHRHLKAGKIKSIKLSERRRGIPVDEIERIAREGI